MIASSLSLIKSVFSFFQLIISVFPYESNIVMGGMVIPAVSVPRQGGQTKE